MSEILLTTSSRLGLSCHTNEVDKLGVLQRRNTNGEPNAKNHSIQTTERWSRRDHPFQSNPGNRSDSYRKRAGSCKTVCERLGSK